MMNDDTSEILRKLGLPDAPEPLEPFTNPAPDLGQSCPQRCPTSEEARAITFADPLGEAISIRGAAQIIGCSPWTVRHKFIPAGLPHERLCPRGKLFFYRNQIIRWLMRRQNGNRSTRPLAP